jgi:hypothetical protein
VEWFPDIILLDESQCRMRLVTVRAAEFICDKHDMSMDQVRHQTIRIEPDNDLLIDIYMTGLKVRDHLGHSLF